MDLHYSQTCMTFNAYAREFESPMDLHYSQTRERKKIRRYRLNPLWIYTTLKPQIRENVLHTSHIIHKRYRFCRIIIFHTNLHQLSIAFHFLKLDIPYFPEK